jgi:type III secretion protein W
MAFESDFRIDNAIRTLDQGTRPEDAGQKAASGSLAGLTLTVASSPESLLADAAEELTFAVDNTEELELKERKEKDSIGTDLLERVNFYRELLREKGLDEKTDALAEALKKGADVKGLLEKAREFFPDPADAFAALTEMAEKRPEDPIIKEALDELESSSGQEIRASIAGALAGKSFPDLGPPLELKNDYAHVVIDFPGALETFGYILERFGENDFDRGVEFLLKALGNDLASDRPSADKAALESVTGQLGRVRTLNGVRALGQKLTDRWGTLAGDSGSKLTDIDFLKFVLEGAKETLPSASMADPLVKLAAPPDIEREVLFRQELLKSVKNVSIQTFSGPEPRGRLLDALQEGLDLAVAREDEWLAAMEDNQ